VAAESFTSRTNIKIADKTFLTKQKFFLEILHSVHEPLKFEEYLKDSNSYVTDKSAYTEFEEVEEFFHTWKRGMLPREHIFSVFNEEQLSEAVSLFNFFYYAKDWTTFYKNVIWARVHLNEGMFIYSLSMAVLHRDDCEGIVLPAPYEICPYMFFDGQVITDAYEFRMKYMQDKNLIKKEYPIEFWESKYILDHETKKNNDLLKDYDMWYTWSNYTSDYYSMNEEYKLDYFREDIGWNAFYYYYHMDYPFWMDGEKFDLSKDRRGEQFLYMHQQLLARYFMERLSHHMGEIPEFSFYSQIPVGYNSHLMYYNGQGFTVRKNYYEVFNTEEFHTIQMVLDYERRIHDVIDYGFYTLRDGTKIDMRKPSSIEYLGNMIQANPDSVDRRFFGYWMLLSHWLVGGSADAFSSDYTVIPSVMEHFETALSDPIFYMLYKRVVKSYIQFKNFLPYYKQKELLLKGVTINNVEIDRVFTYFDHFDTDLTTLMGHDFMFNDRNVMFKARQMRLTHKPFSMSLDITSDKAQKVVIRVYLGPKYDEFGHLIALKENRENFYNIDHFVWDLASGKSVIKRNSVDFYWTINDRTTYTELYKRVMLAIDGKIEFPLDMTEAHCGFPERLLMPRGWVSGMPVQFFFMISPYEEATIPQYSTFDQTKSCGVGSGSRFLDNLPFGYPLDRDIYDETQFMVPNMYIADAKIYYMKNYENFEFENMPQYV